MKPIVAVAGDIVDGVANGCSSERAIAPEQRAAVG